VHHLALRQGQRLRRGTDTAGERNGHATLTWPIVTEIRTRFAGGGISRTALSTEYGVSYGIVSNIVAGRTWKHS
jgi:hypothetical protein